MKSLNALTRLFFCVAVAVAMLSTASAEETGTLKITFKYKGKAPATEFLSPNKDKDFCGKHKIPDERLLVNPENNGIKNVIVYVYTGGRSGTKLPEMKNEKPKTHELANDKCRFEPHVVIARVGDKIKVTNPDTVGHNANFAFFNNKSENLTVPAGGDVTIDLKETEPAPIPVVCNIHEWMKANVVVVDHPFAAKSNENGELIIKGLPVGEEITFRAGHDSASFKKMTLNGKEDGWRSNRFKVDIKPGMNDLGIVEVDKEAIDKK